MPDLLDLQEFDLEHVLPADELKSAAPGCGCGYRPACPAVSGGWIRA